VADFDGGPTTSDAGALLLRRVDRRLSLSDQVAACFTDHRDPRRIRHSLRKLVAQRTVGIALGYEDLIDHDQLRHDPVMALFSEKGRRPDSPPLAGKSTLNRLEHAPTDGPGRYHKIDHDTEALQALLVEPFLQAHPNPPDEIILDLDATDDPLHGEQEQRFFHGYYNAYCTQKSWSRQRRVVAKAEVLPRGPNPRFLVTSLSAGDHPAQPLYEQIYCAPGEMENRIKEQQLDLFADRTSTRSFRANQLRLLMTSFAYVLVETLRRRALQSTCLARATVGSIRLKLLKIGSQVTTSVRRIKVSMASGCPYQREFRRASAPLPP